MRKFRTTGGTLGLDDVDHLFEDKIITCCKCCFKHASNAANASLDKADAKQAEQQ